MSAPSRRELRRDAIAGSATLILAGLYWVGADAIPESVLIGDGIGADALPKALAGALALFSAMLVARSVWAWRRTVPVDDAEAARERMRRHLRAAGMLLIGVAYVAAVGHLGYVLSVFALVCATAWYNGQPVAPRLWMVAVGMTAVFYLLFVKLLGIPQPAGFWPGLLG